MILKISEKPIDSSFPSSPFLGPLSSFIFSVFCRKYFLLSLLFLIFFQMKYVFPQFVVSCSFRKRNGTFMLMSMKIKNFQKSKSLKKIITGPNDPILILLDLNNILFWFVVSTRSLHFYCTTFSHHLLCYKRFHSSIIWLNL